VPTPGTAGGEKTKNGSEPATGQFLVQLILIPDTVPLCFALAQVST